MELQTSKHADYGALACIMAEGVASPHESVCLVALRWLRDFVEQVKEALLPDYPTILAAILPALATGSEECRQVKPHGPPRFTPSSLNPLLTSISNQ